jgi:transposase
MSSAQPSSSTPLSVAALSAENTALRSQLCDTEQQLAALKSQLEWFKRQLFGERSEKRLLIDRALQPDMLADLDGAVAGDTEPADSQTITYRRRPPRSEDCVSDQGLRFDKTVPVKTIHLAPPTDLSADQYTVLTEKISYRLAQRPGSYVILKYVRPLLKRIDSGELIETPAPQNVLDKSIADVSVLAGLLVDKFVYHLPLYRQHQRLRHSGITLSRTTLGNLARRSIELLEPIDQAQFEHIRQSRVIAMDETPIKAGRRQKGVLNRAYFWPVYGEADEIAFSYSASRAGNKVREVLGDDFTGTLISDGYEAYSRYARQHPGVVHAQCWAHTRRYFDRAKEAEPASAAEALEIIGILYRHEATIREQGLGGTAKLEYRQRHSKPVVTAFGRWCEAQCQRHDLLPSNPLSKALRYARDRTEALSVYLADPEVPIDTNHLERALRPIPMGRRNWLFCWTELGAKQVGIIQSLLVTCRLQDVDPYTYLVDVLQRIGRHPARQVQDLTPRRWKRCFADDPLRSDLDP